MKLTTWLIGVPLAVVAITFAVSNRGPVTLDLWPLPLTVDVPVYILALLPFAFGFLLGGLISWVTGGSKRSQIRQKDRAIMNLERELTIAKSHAPESSNEDKTSNDDKAGDNKMIANG